MRYLVLSDIHANLEALDACLADARRRGFDRTLVLGDLVGYGADPNAVVDRVRDLRPAAVVRGNHDKIARGIEEADGFNLIARSAAEWTLNAFRPDVRAWLLALPEGPRVIDEVIEICHGSPFDEDAYIFDELDALKALEMSQRPLCLFGHTHYPVTFERIADALTATGPSGDMESHVDMQSGAKYLVNPGSVGQPRDGNPRAAYGIADTSKMRVELMRITYPVQATQAKVLAAGLPEVLARRLASGR